MESTSENKKLSLKNYKTVLPKELQKLALKNLVRECDESPKNNFVAYVDEGTESFDVSFVFSAKRELEEHVCDCKSSIEFCRHKTALLMHIAEEKKIAPAVKTKAKTKASATETLLDEVNTQELKLWVKNLLAKNKDLELAFVNKFSNTMRVFTVDEAQKISADAVKAIVKNKKNLDPSELKKITDLWADVHSSIVEHYYANVTDENAFAVFHAVLKFCREFNETITVNSNKMIKYIDGLLLHSVEPITNLQLDDAWMKACKSYINKLQEQPYYVNMTYLLHLQNVLAVASPERAASLITLLMKHYSDLSDSRLHNFAGYTVFLFELVKTHGLQDTFCEAFEPIRFGNDYNIQLIRVLIDYGKTDKAEKYSKAQIGINFNEAYNVPYLRFLREIYTLKNNQAALVKTMEALFPFTFHFPDFLFVYENMTDEEEKKKWRTKMLTRSRNSYDHKVPAVNAFAFHLMNLEGKYKKMIEYINDYTSFSIINEYFEPMYQSDKMGLLQKIIKKSNGSFRFASDDKNDEACYPALADKMLKLYSSDFLRSVIEVNKRSLGFYGVNNFVGYLMKVVMSV